MNATTTASPDASRRRSAPSPQLQDQPRLRGVWLGLARAAWIVYVAYVLWGFVYDVPLAFQAFRDPALNAHVGMPLDAYAWISVGLASLMMALAVAVALILFWRRSRDPMALIAGLFLVLFTDAILVGSAPGGSVLPLPVHMPWWLQVLMDAPGSVALYAFFLLFPNGRFAPRWFWALVPLWLCQTTLIDIAFTLRLEWPVWVALGYPLLYAAAIVAQVYRYRRVSTPLERLQTKWVATGLVVWILAGQLGTWLALLTPLGQTLFPVLAQFVMMIAALAVPLAFLVSLQRYHLYEIDRIINQALVYGILTALLAGLYIGGVLGLQALARVTTGQDSPLALVASTLAIVGLVRPLQRRVQWLIDRRFYRTKYNAQKTLAAFGATLRQEVHLPELQERLLVVVEETFQPTSASLWLAPRTKRTPMER